MRDQAPPGGEPGEGLLDDQSRRWRQGECLSVADYLRRHPALRDDTDLLLDLIYHEVVLRERRGESPRLDDYLARFPHLADHLRAMFELHAVAGRDPTPSAPSPAGGEETLSAPSGERLRTPRVPPAQAREDQDGERAPPAVPGYAIEGELGRGGMGVVYKARHLALKRTVALKMILAGGHAGPRELTRFRTEAEAVARLQHRNIVQIYEVGEAEGRPFLSLEFVEGGSLASRLDGTPLPARAAAGLVQTLAQAVHYAHEQGVVHRDLKPANILLVREGEAPAEPPTKGSAGASPSQQASPSLGTPKITDFGLAKLLHTDGAETASGAVVGTPSYMAPEQARGHSREVTPATDVYALGGVLYELLTGRPPFKAATPLDTILQVVGAEPAPPRVLQPAVPRDLETIALKCLQKEPVRRYANALDLADDLGRFLAGEPIRGRPVGRAERVLKWVRRRPGMAAMTAALVLLAAAAVAGVTWEWRDAVEQAGVARQQTAVAEEQTRRAEEQTARARHSAADEARARGEKENALAAEAAARGDAERSRDQALRALAGSRVTQAHGDFLAGEPLAGRGLLDDCPAPLRFWEWHYVKRQGVGGQLTLYGAEQAPSALAFAPDGKTLAAGARDGQVYFWDVATGRLTRAARGHDRQGVTGLAFSPDGRRLVSTGQDRRVVLWDTAARRPVALVPDWTGPLYGAAFSPDGRRLAVATHDGTVSVRDIATGRKLLSLKGGKGAAYGVAFSPDGRRLASGAGDGTVKAWDADSGAEVLTCPAQGACAGLAWSPDGTRLASRTADVVQVWDAGTGRELLALRSASLWPPAGGLAFAPDGRALAAVAGEVFKSGEVRVWDAHTGQALFSLRGHSGAVFDVAFSPDGQRLASSGADGTVKLWDAHGRPEARALAGHDGWGHRAVFNPEGTRLASSGSGSAWMGGAAEVRVWDVRTGREVFALPEEPVRVDGLAYSPDGKLLAYSAGGTVRVRDAGTGRDLFTLGADAGTTFGNCVGFSPDSRLLAAGVGNASRPGEVRVWDVAMSPEGRRAGGRLRFTVAGHTRPVKTLAFSRNGRLLVTGGQDEKVVLWDAATGREVRALPARYGPVEEVVFSPDGGRLAVLHSGVTFGGGFASVMPAEVRVWEVASGRELLALQTHSANVSALAFSPDGERLFCGGDALTVCDAHSGQLLLRVKLDRTIVSLSFNRDGSLLAGARMDGGIWLFDARPTSELATPRAEPGWVNCVRFSGDGRRLVVGGNDCRVRLFDAADGRQLLAVRTENLYYPLSAAADATASRIAAGTTIFAANGQPQPAQVKVWDGSDGRELLTLGGHSGRLLGLAFGADGSRLATGGDDGLVKLWDAATGRELFSFAGRVGPVSGVAFAGQRLVACGANGRTAAWDVQTGKEAPARDVPPAPDWRRARSPDGSLVAVPYDRTVQVLRAEPGEEEMAWRKAYAERDTTWHAREAGRAEEAGRWFAAAFHWEAVRTAEGRGPPPPGLERRLALAQRGAGQTDAYRRTCARLLRGLEAGTDGAVLAGVALAGAPDVVGRAAAARLLTGPPGELAHERCLAVRACLLLAEPPAAPGRLLALAERADPVTRGAVLCRLARHDEAVQALEGAKEGTALLYRALAEHGRGKEDEARQALAEAVRWLGAPGQADARRTNAEQLPWHGRLEAELLRAEAEAALQGPRP
jgi:WD40 repeat protein